MTVPTGAPINRSGGGNSVPRTMLLTSSTEKGNIAYSVEVKNVFRTIFNAGLRF
jgi:hypothetical protein